MSKVEIVCVIDRSGSMSAIRSDAIGGFNTFLAAQKSLPGEATLTLALFDDKYDVTVDNVKLADVKELDTSTYVPRGSTALYDAIGRTIDAIGARLDKAQSKPDKVIVVILTDGEENASREYTGARVAEMIKHQEEKYQWEFIFLAANQDAFAAGGALNIRACNTQNFKATGIGTLTAYASASNLVGSYRVGKRP